MNPFNEKGLAVAKNHNILPKNIRLDVCNLSLSIVEQPPPFSRFCKKVKEHWDTRKQSAVDKGDKVEIATSVASYSAIQGVDIFQCVSLVAEPGHGRGDAAPNALLKGVIFSNRCQLLCADCLIMLGQSTKFALSWVDQVRGRLRY